MQIQFIARIFVHMRDFGGQLLKWYDVNKREMPWRQNQNPYSVWLSEIILQQTRVAQGTPYFLRFLAQYPTVKDLALAPEDEVLKLWQGLGYYSRARRLHEAAQQLVGRPWPSDLEGWLALPGIGRTTAGGILSSAFDAPVPILDGNVKRVLARLTAHPRPPARDDAQFWGWSEALLDPDRPRDFNQALMDLGATVCTPRAPSCERCPWRLHCAAYASGDPCRWPVTDAPKSLPFQVIGVGVVLDASGEVLIDQRLEEGLLGGMWEFPGGKQEQGETIETCIARELKEELGITVKVGAELITVDHAYSHKKLRFVVHLCDWVSGEPQPLASQQVRWVRPDDLGNYAFPAANARIIEALLGSLESSAHP